MFNTVSSELLVKHLPGLDSISLLRPHCAEHYITAHPDEANGPFSMLEQAASVIRENNALILTQYVFGSRELHDAGMKALERACGPIRWPVIWIQGDGCSNAKLTGTQIYAISGASARQLRMNGQAVGGTFEDSDAEYCYLGNLTPRRSSVAREDQARETFEYMETVLRRAGMDFSNVARTWLYLDQLLTWYDAFNGVRTEFFNNRRVFENMVPASTGIGASNPSGAALVTAVLGIKAKNDRVKIQAVPSPLQCPAVDYKSSFSRAVEAKLPDHSRLYVSGTASIAPGGETIHVGDPRKQIACTMEVVKAILNSRDMDWSNTTRAIAYFKNGVDTKLLADYCRENRLPPMPIAISQSDICRDDLLFEIELDAISVTRDRPYLTSRN